MDDDAALDFNFWPSFTDLMLSLVLVMVVVVFVVGAIMAAGSVNLSEVQRNQTKLVEAVSSAYGVRPSAISRNMFGVSTARGEQSDIRIVNEPTLQRITFTDNILFVQDDYHLSEKGQRALRVVGAAIRDQGTAVREIQIQGHADASPTSKFASNLHLAAFRAIEVFAFLQHDVGLDPVKQLMSATSFGEFKPVQRSENDVAYDSRKLAEHNATRDLKGRNRRIELLLFYDI